MKKMVVFGGMFLFVIFLVASKKTDLPTSINQGFCVHYYTSTATELTEATKQLQLTLNNISSDTNTIQAAKKQLAACRMVYKKIEFFANYFLETRVNIFNQAPVYEIEEPYMEYQHPIGLQAVEAILFGDDVLKNKAELTAQAEVLHTTASGLKQYLYGKQITDYDILEALRLELIRIYTLGITGYDAPELKTGIAEAYQAMDAVDINLQPYLNHSKPEVADSVRFYLQKCKTLLLGNLHFNAFNRAAFYTEAALPLQQHVGHLILQLQLQKQSSLVLNYAAPHIFSQASIHPILLNGVVANNKTIALGKKLFTEPLLSGNGRRSCATCHSPARYFSDGQVASMGIDGYTRVNRNAPSLLYAAYQHNQFLDGRAADLPSQMVAVLSSPLEMNATPSIVLKKLKLVKGYLQMFKKAYPNAASDSLITLAHIAEAIASYEQSFTITTSAFDRYINGDKNAMNTKQVNGFNLFMGKAFCGTCHFAPLFNGLLPPAYSITEVESLGLTSNTNFKKPIADMDSGRYKFFPISFYLGAFKTPTVRNTAQTAPYMHNGAFNTLKQVLEFYNKGGGVGLGLRLTSQTLSAKPLGLSPAEMENIILFLGALTDKPL